jgi:hypothetical protein
MTRRGGASLATSSRRPERLKKSASRFSLQSGCSIEAALLRPSACREAITDTSCRSMSIRGLRLLLRRMAGALSTHRTKASSRMRISFRRSRCSRQRRWSCVSACSWRVSRAKSHLPLRSARLREGGARGIRLALVAQAWIFLERRAPTRASVMHAVARLRMRSVQVRDSFKPATLWLLPLQLTRVNLLTHSSKMMSLSPRWIVKTASEL